MPASCAIFTQSSNGKKASDARLAPFSSKLNCFAFSIACLSDEGRIIARYVGENPNGSRNLIAGITNERGNVVGLMPHPEHAIDSLTGPSADGLGFFTSVLKAMVK